MGEFDDNQNRSVAKIPESNRQESVQASGSELSLSQSVWLSMRRAPGILADGLASGVQGAVLTTLDDYQQAKAKFWSNKSATAQEYLCHRLPDFLFGAGLALSRPKGWTHALLVAGSFRGLATSTARSIYQAGDPQISSQVISGNYSEAISHEGSSFLSCLPAAMAGNTLGRMGSNAIFGTGKGVVDMASEGYFRPWKSRCQPASVTAEEVKSNLWEMHDRVRPPRISVIFSDVDDTLVRTKEGVAHALKINKRELAQKFNMTEQEVASSLGQVIETSRNLDHSWQLEESSLRQRFAGSDLEFHESIAKPYYHNIEQSRKIHGGAYDGVHVGLTQLRSQGVRLIGYSNGRQNDIKTRLGENNIEQHFDCVYTQGVPEPLNPRLSSTLAAPGYKRISDALDRSSRTEYLALSPELAKPNPECLTDVCRILGKRPSEVAMLGDSRMNDGWAAARAKVRYIRIKDHITAEAEHQLASLKEPSPAGQTKVNEYPPVYAEVDRVDQIPALLQPKADYKGIARSTFGAGKQALLDGNMWGTTALSSLASQPVHETIAMPGALISQTADSKSKPTWPKK